MKEKMLLVLILAILHRCRACHEIRSNTCYGAKMTDVTTTEFCLNLPKWFTTFDLPQWFTCNVESKVSKLVLKTCHETICCNGYESSWNNECRDINECSTRNGGCSDKCVNIQGSYYCECHDGYSLDGNQRSCRDTNECWSGNGGCSHTCVNNQGSFQCTCPAGFSLDWRNQRTCNDNNDCSIRNGGCSHTCEHTEGSYHCTCPPGFTLDSNKLTCNAEATTLEVATPVATTPYACGTKNIECSHTCVKVNGTFKCTCPAMMNLDDDHTTCIDVRLNHGRGNDYCLCVVLILCVMFTTVRLTSKMFGWRWAAPCGYRKMPTKDLKPFVIAEECVVEFNDNNPPPYKEKRDEIDISYKKTAIF